MSRRGDAPYRHFSLTAHAATDRLCWAHVFLKSSRRLPWLGLVLGTALLSAPALANGRFPAADQLVIDPGDEQHLLLRTTFGLLDSRDAGSSWSWICEGAVGYMGDPALSVLLGGASVAAYFGALSVSAEQGCGWKTTLLDTKAQYALDSTLDPGDASRALILTVSIDGSRHVSVLSVDAAGTIAATLDVADGFVPNTIEVAPSRPERIYVTALTEPLASVLLVSDDRGQSWQTRPVHPYETSPLFISAVDPTDPDKIYARVDGALQDHLLVSADAGQHWSDVFSLDNEMLGFALSPDASRLAVGGLGAGLYVASSAELSFQPVPGAVQSLRCLKWTSAGLFACGDESVDGWTLARSTDQGQSFAPLWHVTDLVPLACPAASTTGAVCPLAWPDVALVIGAESGAAGRAGASGTAPAGTGSSSSSCALKSAPGLAGSAGLARWSVLLALLALRRRPAQGTSK
jgi:photosystem II stability/assembly factor-like uncharacterized protein